VVVAVQGGTHTIFVAEVVAAKVQDSSRPIVYFDWDYHTAV
jgi:flavin reductase (DIM6/NTAB) family NADH-FMN oxidoreductase RutF